MKYVTTANRLAIALSNKDMTPAELSRRAGISEPSLSQYMNGANRPSKASADKISKVLDVDPLWLMGYDLRPREPESSDLDEMLEALAKRKELQTLLDASNKLSKEDIEFLLTMVERMNSK